jgi:hypothetical protein
MEMSVATLGTLGLALLTAACVADTSRPTTTTAAATATVSAPTAALAVQPSCHPSYIGQCVPFASDCPSSAPMRQN